MSRTPSTVEDNDRSSPLITANPTSEIVVVGTSVTFAAAATGDPPLTYQWKKGTTAVEGCDGSQPHAFCRYAG